VNRVFVHGIGAVSPAGWGVPALRAALKAGQPLPTRELLRPGRARPLVVRAVPAPAPKPGFLANPRLRRTSTISQYAAGAVIEALGAAANGAGASGTRLGIVLCVMNGCVAYSRRFYDETLRDPATASPLVFPETVFNAPGSHLAALLGTTEINYTLVGDPGTFLQGLALAAQWLDQDEVEGCVVVGAEETDWTTADAFRLFSRKVVPAEGAGALYLRRERAEGAAELQWVTEPEIFFDESSRAAAAGAVRKQFANGTPAELLCDGQQSAGKFDAAEGAAWKDWLGTRLSPKRVLGEGLTAAAAWQCVAALDRMALGHFRVANVSVVGCNQQAIGARFVAGGREE
jgi:3-oxoacyl-[acyl-carrier-protein] synthase II